MLAGHVTAETDAATAAEVVLDVAVLLEATVEDVAVEDDDDLSLIHI